MGETTAWIRFAPRARFCFLFPDRDQDGLFSFSFLFVFFFWGRDVTKPSAWRRGYDADHRRTRTLLTPQVAAGLVNCWRCGQPILPRQSWDLGHDDHDRSKYMGPEHANAADCPQGGNRATKRLDRRDPAPRSATWWQTG